MNYINFDIETYNPSKSDKFSINEFRVSVAGAYISWIDKYVAFLEEDILDLIELFKEADLIVGYNQISFDLAVLQKYTKFNLQSLPNYDILKEIEKILGFRLKLDNICEANFGEDVKTDSYEKFKHYYWDKKWFELIDYCMNDVRLTEKIFRKIRNEEQVFYTDLYQKKEILLPIPTLKKIKKAETEEEVLL
jgi:hypothetical protein